MLTPPVLQHLPPDFGPGDGSAAMPQWIAARQERAQVSLIETGPNLIGLLFLFRTEPAATTDLHIGYLLAEEAWGQGYATEVLNGLIDHLRDLAPVTLRAGVAADNPASARVLIKVGFAPDEAPTTSDTQTYHLTLTARA